MRKILVVIGLICCVFSSVQAQSFEGSFVMHIQDDNSVSMMNVFVRKDKVIFQPVDPSARPVKILLSKSNNDVFVLMEANDMKLAIKSTVVPPAIVPSNPPSDSLPPPRFGVRETGKTKTLEGYLCKEVIVSDFAKEYQLWITPELGFTMAEFYEYLAKFSAAVNEGDYEEIVKFNSMDVYKNNMSLETKEIKEKDATVILIKKIVKTTLPESDFSTEGYRIVDRKDLHGTE